MIQNYITVALRNLRRNLSYTLLNVFGLALSLGCSILIFLLVRQHLSFDTWHTKTDRIALIGTESRGETVEKMPLTPFPMSAALRQEYSFLEKTAMVSSRSNSLITIEEQGAAPVKFKEENTHALAEPELFDIFDLPLTQGSFSEFREPYTALLTEKLARKYYGTTDAVGKTFKLNAEFALRVVGILKDIPDNTALQYQMYTSWKTMEAVDSNARRMLENWGGIRGGTQCYVLFREGHSAAELESAFAGFREKYFHPEVKNWYYHTLPLNSIHLDPDYGSGTSKSYLWTLSLIGLFLLLTACVNFVNMATAQALNRAREVGVRKTMGSTRGQLFGQFMAETSLIVLIATGLSLMLARLGMPFLNDLTGLGLTLDFSRDGLLYGFLALLMLVVVFLAGAYPGVVQSGFRPVESLKGALDSRRVGGFSLRRVLVGVQFAISQILIIGAVVVTAQMEYARTADLGFRREGIVTLPLADSETDKKKTLKQELEQIAGVEQISLCMQPPASGANWKTQVQLEGRNEREPWAINFKFADASYAETFGLQFVAGRNLQASDTLREFIVNETVVKKLNLASAEEIIGKKLDVDGRLHTVVGVVKDFHNHSFRDAIEPVCMGSDIENYDVCAVKINLQNTQPTLAAFEKTWTAIYPDQFYEYDFMDEWIAEFYEEEAMLLQLVRLFAGIAIFVGCLGLYGLAAFMVARKTKEIGIRKTLGASVPGILWLFGKEYVRLIVFAFVVAAPLAWWAMSNWLADYAYRISIGAGIFLLSLVVTVLVAFLTVSFQSVKAALANPVKSLRSE
ncbi:MAG: ABC transporter permease [Saprospiraceae bacterium]|nr:ABC transporter permease [Saprospiraceae bacterium]